MPCVYIQMNGGLGNQMFQVAAAYAYSRRHRLRLAIQRTKESYDRRPMYWDSVLSAFATDLVDSIPAGVQRHGERLATIYTSPPASCSDIHLLGYYQCPAYFEDCAAGVADRMSARPDVLKRIREKYATLLAQSDRIVVVHARRTDYCANDYARAVHGPLSVDYYVRGIARMDAVVPDAHFLLVADDPSWWSQVIPACPTLGVAGSYTVLDEPDEVLTLGLLQQFRAFVLANSTFSWWAAWLAGQAGATRVIAPAEWTGPKGMRPFEDIYCAEWEKI